MVYESSYESGLRPFNPDLQRGQWEQPRDFLFACFGLAFKLDIFTASYWLFMDMGITSILPFYIYMVLFLVPVMVIHSFMGQFASSGFISAFRISPFFKGMGYVSLALSISLLTYYSLFAVVPILFIFYSLRPTLPWSCENVKTWHTENNTICDVRNSSLYDGMNEFEDTLITIPSVLFSKELFKDLHFWPEGNETYTLSWCAIGVTLLLWLLIAFIFYRFSDTAKFGKLLRYLVLITLGLLGICIARFSFLPGALYGLSQYTSISMNDMMKGFYVIPIYAIQAFGAGWGTIIALSSFNKFKTNIMKYSWIIAFGQMLILILFGMVSFMLDRHFQEKYSDDLNYYVEHHWMIFLGSASALAALELPHFWTILFYSMLFLASLIVMTTQIFTILKSLFDEFEQLRERKEQFTFGFIGAVALSSLFFCSNHGLMFFSALSTDALLMQTLLHLLLLLVVLWIYGRVRFQRDIEFMLGERFASWKITILRYVTPLMLVLTLLSCIFIAFFEHVFSPTALGIISFLLILAPVAFIPAYGVYIMFQTTGTFGVRLRRACRPTDWYPLQTEDRQNYEESMGTTDITHQLHEVTEEIN